MKLRKVFNHALGMVIHSKLRSWLTIIGIVIGVAAVISIVSIGEGMQAALDSRMSGLGGDLLTITAGYTKGGSMFKHGGGGGSGGSVATEEEIVVDRADVQSLKGISDVSLIDINIRGNVDVSYLGKTGKVSLTGVDPKVWSQITTAEIRDGRLLDSADQNVIVIGEKLADNYFEQPVGINKMITIEGSAFRVVGILKDVGNTIYTPISMGYQLLDDKTNDVYDSITVKIKNEDELDYVIEKIEKKLMVMRHVNEKTRDFSISSSKQVWEARADMMGSVNAFLIAIAAVSLIVGAVGIANTMFTAVLEKTKEIGIMKAIGARNKDILLIFLFNSALIGMVGGLIGIFFGTLMASLIPKMMGEVMFLKGGTIVSTKSIVMALSVSISVGIMAGIIPAYQASKLKPVDALRYE